MTYRHTYHYRAQITSTFVELERRREIQTFMSCRRAALMYAVSWFSGIA